MRLIISGGGTGGHIFPALAIANAIKAQRPDADILFVGANGKMEMEKVPAAGYRIEGLDITGIERSLSPKNLMFPFRLLGSLMAARRIISKHKPQAVVGVGGFASGPVLLVAQMMGIPTLIQEQNSFAGITNRWLGRRAKRICVAYPGMEKFFPKECILLTGNPVRKDILDLAGKRAEAMAHFNLDPSKRTLLVIGGSLGARSINLAIAAHLEQLSSSGIQVIWQTGKLFADKAKEVLDSAPLAATCVQAHAFISRMDLAYAASDAVLSRAGASSISELCIVGKASVLVPFPFAAEDHQTVNARSLAERGAAILVPDKEAMQLAIDEALALMNDPARCAEMAAKAKSLALPTADDDIANEVLRLAA